MAAPKQVKRDHQPHRSSGYFTMIFIDNDDTLIPSKLQRYLFRNLEIDIFDLYQQTAMLQQFQYGIIHAIEEMKRVFLEQYHEEVRIAIVSNASTKWLNLTINNEDGNANFKLLSRYFQQHDITITSAIDETFEFLCKKFGKGNERKVTEMISMSLDPNNTHHSKYMLKYTAYSSIINQYKRKLRRKCRKIVNIGDGETELDAIKYYSQTFGVDYIALKFIQYSTFHQLSYQWKYITNNFQSILYDMDVNRCYRGLTELESKQSTDIDDDSAKTNRAANARPLYRCVVVDGNTNKKKQFKHKRSKSNVSDTSIATTESHEMLNTFYFDYVLKNDNNQYFTATNQVTAIATYFEKWIQEYVCMQPTHIQQRAALRWMCSTIHARMRGKDAYSPQMMSFKKILKEALCKSQPFQRAFQEYYNEVRNQVCDRQHHRASKSLSLPATKPVMVGASNHIHSVVPHQRMHHRAATNINGIHCISMHPLHSDSTKKKQLTKPHGHAISAKKHVLHHSHHHVHGRNVKDGSLSLMNVGRVQHRRNSTTSQGTITTNSVNTTPKSLQSEHRNPMYHSMDDTDDEIYLGHNSTNDADEENSSSAHGTPLQYKYVPRMFPLDEKRRSY